MIHSFADRDTERLYNDEQVRRFQAIERAARRKLQLLAAATSLEDLKVPPGNRLKALSGDREGNMQSALTSNGGFASGGTTGPTMSRSSIITEVGKTWRS